MILKKNVLIMGGNGALGRAIVSAYRASNWKVLSLDLSKNNEASENLIISGEGGKLYLEESLFTDIKLSYYKPNIDNPYSSLYNICNPSSENYTK